jgi:hypothetical protein
MRIDLRKARALCTAAEFELVAASGGKALAALGEARLKSKITRARALRDKYRDLHRRQRLEARRPGAKPARADANARTASKAELFEQVLARFVERYRQLRKAAKPVASRRTAKAKPAAVGASSKRSVAKTAAPKKPEAGRAGPKPGAAGHAPGSAAGLAATMPERSPKAPAPSTPLATKPRPPSSRGFISEEAAQRSRNVRLKSMNARNVQAHIGARGRRNQAKRDSRPR